MCSIWSRASTLSNLHECVCQLTVAICLSTLSIPCCMRSIRHICLSIHMCQIFASACPAVINQHSFTSVKARLYLLYPVTTQLSFDCFNNSSVFIAVRCSWLRGSANLLQNKASSLSQNAVLAGQFVSKLVQSSRINYCSSRTCSCASHCYCYASRGCYFLYSSVNQSVCSGCIRNSFGW